MMKNAVLAVTIAVANLPSAVAGFAGTPAPDDAAANLPPGMTAPAAAQPADRPAAKLSEADRAWLDVRAAAFMPDFSAQLPADPASRKAALAERAAVFVRTADRAQDFYTRHPAHAKAAEARLVEVRALVAANQTGDATIEGRLLTTVQALRGDGAVPAALRVQAVSAYAFPKAMRGSKSRAERLEAAIQVARSLAAEFPDQPQGPESLVNLALGSDEATARSLTNEVLARPAPPAIRQLARAFLARLELVGKPIAAEFDGAGLTADKAALAGGRPTIVYTWAVGSPGSLRLAADLKKYATAANVIGLNLDQDTRTAEALAQKEGLAGTMVYDERGVEGALAQRLKTRGAPQVILVDAQGIIREVRGENDLAKKIQAFGL